MSKDQLINREKIEDAYECIKDSINHTPLNYDPYLSQSYKANIFLKREDLQRVRSFKLRGAYNAIVRRKEKIKNGVVCASSGNHAQGVAYTCNKLNINASIFMPTTTPAQKISQVRFFGGEYVDIQISGDTFDVSANQAREFAKDNAMEFINPFDDVDIIAGQGTLGIEILQDLQKKNIKPDYILIAIGGGGLISGIGSYVKAISPQTQIIGVEAAGSPSMQAAFDAGHPIKLPKIDKFVDGVAVAEVGKITYEVAKKVVDRILRVPEGLVCCSILDLYNKQAIVVEPAGALSVSALEFIKKDITGKNVVCLISGGNSDINRMAEIEERALIYQGHINYFIVHFPQRPGALKEFVNDILGPEDDIILFEYVKRVNLGTGPVILGLYSKNKEEVGNLILRMRSFDQNFLQLGERPQGILSLL